MTTDPAELEWQSWVARNVGELLAAAPTLTEEPSRVSVARALSICIIQTTEGNLTEFARRLGFLKSAVSQWRSNKALPQLSVLLKLCRSINVSLIDFLLHLEASDRTKSLTTSSSDSQPILQQPKRQLETSHLEQALQAALEEEPPPTMRSVAQRLGYNTRSICRRFPALCSAISARYLNYRDENRIAKIEQCCQEVRQIATYLYNQGLEPTRSCVAQHLKKPAYFRDPIVAAALDAVRKELGLE